MMRFVLPILLALVGVGVGGGVGYMLKPEPETKPEAAEAADAHAAKAKAHAAAGGGDKTVSVPHAPEPASDSAYVPLSRKLIVPIVRSNGRKAFVALAATLEMDPDKAIWAETHEPKTFDAFLRVLIAFAATGAFDDHSQSSAVVEELNGELLKAARKVLGEYVRQVLIADLITQDA